MVKKSPSGLSLLNQKHPMGKNKTDPYRTDAFLTKILNSSRELTPPPKGDIPFLPYNGSSYTINREWIIKSLNGEEMKYFFHPQKRGARLRLRKKIKKNGELVEQYVEVGILQIMAQKFWPYLEGYANYKANPRQMMLIPKDGNYENMHYTNLKFVNKKLFKEQGSKRESIKIALSLQSTTSLSELQWTHLASIVHIRRVAHELSKSGQRNLGQRREQLKQELGIPIALETVPIYEALLESQGHKSNLEIAEMIWPNRFVQAKTNKEKKNLTMPIVRVRKKLTDLGKLTTRPLQQVKDELIVLLQQKTENWFTHQQIADKLWLSKQQVDNFSRKVPKKKGAKESDKK